MKRTIALILVLMLALAAAALADNMMVVNCNEWVSLRREPSTKAERLKKVPLYAVVETGEWAEKGFTRCTYEGVTGYIQDQYLEPMEPDEPGTVLDVTLPRQGMSILAYRQYDDSERLAVTGYASNGAQVWTMTTGTDSVTELDATTAFIGGTADDPHVMVYNSYEGLYALDPATGETIWHLPDEEIHLGAGLSTAVDDDGTMFISGYYGPDPVCIDADGNVVWQSSAGSDDIYWPYEITLTRRGVETRYAMMYGEYEGTVVYDRADGHILSVNIDK